MSEIELIETSKERLFEIISDKNFKIMELYKELEEKNKEIEKQYEEKQTLINGIVEEYHTKDTKKIERLNNIIKEAREYINRELLIKYKQDFELIEISHIKKILEILDKGE